MKRLILMICVLSLMTALLGCKAYDSSDFIGLTSDEIIEKFGEFDNVGMPPSEDGLYRSCACGYVVTESRKGFLGTTPPELFVIHFDDSGIAYKCAYETGGKGG